jgi:hypothetical protein
MKTKIILASFFLAIFLFSSLVIAGEITCDDCLVGKCKCEIDRCENATVMRAWSTSSKCRGLWDYEYKVSGDGLITWYPKDAKVYYIRVYAVSSSSDSEACTPCTSIEAVSTQTTSTSVPTTPTTSITTSTAGRTTCPYECCIDEFDYYDKSCDSSYSCKAGACVKEGGSNLWWILLLIIILVVVVIAFLFLRGSGKKKPKTTYAELYRKWGARRYSRPQ